MIAMSWLAFLALQAAEPAETAPLRFADGSRNPALLGRIAHGVEPGIAFASRFSRAEIVCGTGCASTWFVDRASGLVIQGPADRETSATMALETRTRTASDVATVVYGPRAAAGNGGCTLQAYRLRGTRFVRIGTARPEPCPN